MRRLVIFLVALGFTACSSSTPSATTAIDAEAITITPLTAPAVNERIVALANGSAEILYALGAGSALVGRDIASTFAGDVDVPIVTSAHSISAEKVLAQQPTLVITDSRSGPAEALAQIKTAGVRIASVPDAWTLSDMTTKITAIAALVGLQQEARALIKAQQERLSQLPKRVNGIRVAFLYLRGTSSIYLLGGKGSGADSLLTGIGAVDVGAAAGLKAFTPLTSEGIVKLKPQVLLVMTKGLESVGGIDGLITLPGIAQTDAGKNRRVIAVDDSLLLSFGPRTPALMELLAERIMRAMK